MQVGKTLSMYVGHEVHRHPIHGYIHICPVVRIKSTIKDMLRQAATLMLPKEQSGNKAHQILRGIHGSQS